MFIKTFDYKGWAANTLSPNDLGTHEDGWTVTGETHEDYYVWVNDFKASHPVLGKVEGNFENEVVADSKQAYNHFIKHHPPHEWDYGDI